MGTKSSGRLLLWILVLALCLSGCGWQATPPAFASASPAWSCGIRLGTAYQLEAPSIFRVEDAWTAAWADGANLYLVSLSADGITAPVQPLPYGPRTPWNPVLLPAPDDGWHLIWQDLDLFGEPHLYSARLDRDGVLLRGPVQLSQQPVSTIAASLGDGLDVILVWADAGPQPDLYGTRLDTQGRPSAGPPTLVARQAAWPALNRLVDGRWALTWLSMSDSLRHPAHSQITQAQISAGPLPWSEESVRLIDGEHIQLGEGNYIERVQLGLDEHYGYLFIGQRSAESRLARTDAWIFALEDDAASPPSSLINNLTLPAEIPHETLDLTTGFNTGPALALTTADEQLSLPVSRPATPIGQYDVLPVAFDAGTGIVVGYFQEGAAVGYQPVIDQAEPAGAIDLWVDRDRYLHLAWANTPSITGGPATLLLGGTHPILREMPTEH